MTHFLTTAFVSIILLVSLIFATPWAQAEEGRAEPLQLETYKPMDILFGRPYTKIDLSFKTRILEDRNVYFGYTQLMMWKLFYKDPYFEDLNYSPEVFYRVFTHQQIRWIDFGIFQHESNGFGSTNEKSWNRSYVRYHSENDLSSKNKIYWSVTGWAPYDYARRNPDIIRYRGLYEINTTISGILGSWARVGDLTLRIFPGGRTGLDPALGGQELTLRYLGKGISILPPLEFQFFHGFGENMLDYKTRHLEFRVGIGF